MIASVTQNYALDKLPFGWFDVAAVLILGFGVWRGRKNGMTKETLPLFQSVTTIVVAGLGCEMAGQLMAGSMGLTKSTSLVLGYLTLAFVVFIVFTFVKRLFVEKLSGTNFFGGAEYYLAMVSGMVRYAMILIFALALLNAPVYSSAEISARSAYVQRWYGADYFPGLQELQQGVFKNSFLGRGVKDYLGMLLINTIPPEGRNPAAKTGVINIQH